MCQTSGHEHGSIPAQTRQCFSPAGQCSHGKECEQNSEAQAKMPRSLDFYCPYGRVHLIKYASFLLIRITRCVTCWTLKHVLKLTAFCQSKGLSLTQCHACFIGTQPQAKKKWCAVPLQTPALFDACVASVLMVTCLLTPCS